MTKKTLRKGIYIVRILNKIEKQEKINKLTFKSLQSLYIHIEILRKHTCMYKELSCKGYMEIL